MMLSHSSPATGRAPATPRISFITSIIDSRVRSVCTGATTTKLRGPRVPDRLPDVPYDQTEIAVEPRGGHAPEVAHHRFQGEIARRGSRRKRSPAPGDAAGPNGPGMACGLHDRMRTLPRSVKLPVRPRGATQ